MTAKITIKDGTGTNSLVQVSEVGELIVDSIGEPESKFQAMNLTDTAFNFFLPKAGRTFHITAILFNTPGGGAVIDIYEAESVTSTTITTQILKMDIAAKGFFPVTLPFGGFLPVTRGSYLNSKTDSSTVNMTIVGFYKRAL